MSVCPCVQLHVDKAGIQEHMHVACMIMYVLGDSTLASATGCETKKRGVYTEDFLSRTSNRDLSSLGSSGAGYVRITNDLSQHLKQ